jgi:expansin (peptidoglycan-binding protein)
MKTPIVAAILGIFLLAASAAAQTPTDPANCGLNQGQVNAGWECVVYEGVPEYYSTTYSQGAAVFCQDWVINEQVYAAINPAGRQVGHTSSGYGDPVLVDTYNRQSNGGSCNYSVM